MGFVEMSLVIENIQLWTSPDQFGSFHLKTANTLLLKVSKTAMSHYQLHFATMILKQFTKTQI